MNVRRLFAAAALATVAWAATSWWLKLPPFDAVNQAEHIELASDNTKSFPSKTPFRFGSRALAGICTEYSLDEDALIQQLESLGIKSKPEWAIKRIAEENDTEVKAVFVVIRQMAEQND